MSFKLPSDKRRVVEVDIVPHVGKVCQLWPFQNSLFEEDKKLSYVESRNNSRHAVLHVPVVALWEITPFLEMAAHMVMFPPR